MNTIHKFRLTTGYTDLILREGFEVLHVAIQFGEPCIWIKMNLYNPNVVIKFRTIHTGEDFHETNLKYVGTFVTDTFVGHVFHSR